jgi:hypothetical protein
MKIALDKLQHLIMGVFAALFTVLLVLIARKYGVGPAMAAASTTVGIGFELMQKYRKQGEPSVKDAAATALPGWAAWGVLALTKAAQTGQIL